MFTTSILRYLKKNQILTKTFHVFSSTWTLFFKLPQILGPIQVFVSSFKNMIITIQLLKFKQTKIKK
jgi:hypothetical protein